MFDSTSFKLISGFLGLLVLGFLVLIVAGSIHLDSSDISGTKDEVSSVQTK
jgi:hypothetical protein